MKAKVKRKFIDFFWLSEEDLEFKNWIEPLIAVAYLFSLFIGFWWFVGSL